MCFNFSEAVTFSIFLLPQVGWESWSCPVCPHLFSVFLTATGPLSISASCLGLNLPFLHHLQSIDDWHSLRPNMMKLLCSSSHYYSSSSASGAMLREGAFQNSN
jgi:hypothetical protein